MNSKDKALLEKFCAQESSSLIGLKLFWATNFSIMSRVRWHFSHQWKNDQSYTHQSPPHQVLYLLPIKALLRHSLGGNVPSPYWPDPNGKSWIKTQAVKPLKIILSVSVKAYPIQKLSITAKFSLDILRI